MDKRQEQNRHKQYNINNKTERVKKTKQNKQTRKNIKTNIKETLRKQYPT